MSDHDFQSQVQENLEDFIETIDSGNIIEDSGVENIISGINNEAYLLPEDYPLHEFTLDELRRFPRFLTDSLLLTHTNAITLDNELYWAWTAACANTSTYDETSSIASISFLQDYFSMVHLCLLPKKQSLLDQRISQFIASMNPHLNGIQTEGYNFAASAGFSLLEGLLKRHADHLDENGLIVNGPIEDPSWRDNTIGGGGSNYHDKLQIWREYDSSTVVSQTLADIDDSNRYDSEILTRKIAGLPDDQELSENFLRTIADQRNYNVHGELSTQAIGPLVLNLCSLVIWDSIQEETYDDIQSEVIGNIKSQQKMPNIGPGHPNWPSTFYPI